MANQRDPFLEQIEKASEDIRSQEEGVVQTVDWERSLQDIQRRIRIQPAPRPLFYTWRILVPTLASVLLVGVMIGYMLFRQAPAPLPEMKASSGQINSLDRMESVMAKKEVLSYLKQSQFVLSDLMKQCSLDETTPMRNHFDRNRVKILLAKSRYFESQLNESHLAGSKSLMRKIRWILYEIAALEDEISCLELKKMQKTVQQERLMFKIRLIEDELKGERGLI